MRWLSTDRNMNKSIPGVTPISKPVLTVRNAVPGKLTALTVGMIVKAEVIQNGVEKLLSINQQFYTSSGLSLVKSGQSLKLEVISAGKQPVLKVLNDNTTSGAINQQRLLDVPRQDTLLKLIKLLPQVTHLKECSHTKELQHAVQKLLAKLPTRVQAQKPEGVKQLIQNSGVNYENRLASVSSNNLFIRSDIKAALMIFKDELQRLNQLQTKHTSVEKQPVGNPKPVLLNRQEVLMPGNEQKPAPTNNISQPIRSNELNQSAENIKTPQVARQLIKLFGNDQKLTPAKIIPQSSDPITFKHPTENIKRPLLAQQVSKLPENTQKPILDRFPVQNNNQQQKGIQNQPELSRLAIQQNTIIPVKVDKIIARVFQGRLFNSRLGVKQKEDTIGRNHTIIRANAQKTLTTPLLGTSDSGNLSGRPSLLTANAKLSADSPLRALQQIVGLDQPPQLHKPALPRRRDFPLALKHLALAESASGSTTELLEAVESSLSRHRLNQIESLPREGGSSREWLMDIPIIGDEESDVLQMRIEQEKSGQGKEGEESWSIEFGIAPIKLGPLHARLRLQGELLSITLWASEPATENIMLSYRDRLLAKLRNAGVNINDITIFSGTPKNKEAEKSAGSLMEYRV